MNFYFIGVSTKNSAIRQIMPLWAQALKVDLNLVGIDLPIDATTAQYRNAILCIKEDPEAVGSVVTTHKLNVFEHAHDLFDEFDALSSITKEVCMIKKHGTRLIGMAAPDRLSNTLCLKKMLGSDHWRVHKAVALCFGAGGVARAIALSVLCDFEASSPLARRLPNKPQQLVMVDIDDNKLRSMQALLEPLSKGVAINYICQSDATANDQLVNNLPNHSLVINATGMGKDRPGSPITDRARFPHEGIAWELNYRGERQFLQQAMAQVSTQQLQIHDGWQCFLNGWGQAVQIGIGRKLSSREVFQLEKIAEPFRMT
jgi:shikimate 5-dehydrogenase